MRLKAHSPPLLPSPAQAHPLDAIAGRTSKTAMTNWRRQPLVLEGEGGEVARPRENLAGRTSTRLPR